MSNTFMTLFLLIFISKSSLSQSDYEDVWGNKYKVLTEELNVLHANVSVILAKLYRIERYEYCSAEQCERLRKTQLVLNNQLQNISLQTNANSKQIQDNENRIRAIEIEKANQKKIEALEHQCELTFPYGGDIEQYRALVYTWIIPGANASLTSAAGWVESPAFPVPDHGFSAQSKIERDGDGQYTMSTQFIGIGDIKEVPAVHYVQVDQSGECRSAIYTDMFLFGGYLTGYNYFRPLTRVLSAPYLSSANTLAFNVHVESPHSMQNVFSYSGILIDRMEDFRWRKGRVDKGYAQFYYGPYFYTSAQGYKVNVRVLPGGAQKVTFLVCFVLGKFDHQLTTDFVHTTSVTIFNQKIPSLALYGSLQWNLKDKNYYNVEVNIPPNFERDYILDDTLYYKVVIKS